MTNDTDIRERIYAAVHGIPRGKVSTYGQIAQMAGIPRGARLVGNTLSKLPGDSRLPWHRVINSQRRISFPPQSPAYERQKSLLEAEGVLFRNGRVDWRRFGWPD